MAVRSLPKLIAFLLLGPGSLSVGGLAFAQAPGDTSGTSAGTNVQPSTRPFKKLAARARVKISCRGPQMRLAHPVWRESQVLKVAQSINTK